MHFIGSKNVFSGITFKEEINLSLNILVLLYTLYIHLKLKLLGFSFLVQEMKNGCDNGGETVSKYSHPNFLIAFNK